MTACVYTVYGGTKEVQGYHTYRPCDKEAVFKAADGCCYCAVHGEEWGYTNPKQMNLDNIAMQDAKSIINTNALVQRYSDTKDSFVTLRVGYEGQWILKDDRTGSAHELCREFTSPERLAAHWASFMKYHQVSR